MQALGKAHESKEMYSFLSAEHPEEVYEPKEVSFTQELMEELKIPLLATSVSLVVSLFFRKPPLWMFTLTLATCTLTIVAKKLFEGYAIWDDIEQFGLGIVRTLPYLQIIAAVICFVFSWYFPLFSACLSVGLGVLTGINAEAISIQASAEAVREMLA